MPTSSHRGCWTTCVAICGWAWGRARAAFAATAPQASCTKQDIKTPPRPPQRLADFAQKRWKGQRPLLWGQSLRQAMLDEQIYRGILGLESAG